MDGAPPRPNPERLSAVTAALLLTYALMRVVILPTFATELDVFGLIIILQLNASLVMLTLAAALAAAGTDWLLRSHPLVSERAALPEHWIVPGLAAFGIGAVLSRIPAGPAFWLGYLLSAILLIAVLNAEFIVHDPADPRRPAAGVGLTALAYLLLLGVFFTMYASGLRAIFTLPLGFLATLGVTWRLLYLRLEMALSLQYAFIVGLITAQIQWGIHYWPLAPLRTALLLGLVAYLGCELALVHAEDRLSRTRLIEFGVLTGLALTGILVLV